MSNAETHASRSNPSARSLPTSRSLPTRKPEWLRVRMPGGSNYEGLRKRFRELDLSTVCEEAGCPNIGECWSEGTATIMVLGDTCTRGCRFCSVTTGNPQGFVDPREPEHVAGALGEMGLAYVVITMVDRDDIFDGGATHLAKIVRSSKQRSPELLIETLVGDFQGQKAHVETVVRQGRPDVFAHNVEVVPRLQRPIRDARCSWQRSIDVLVWAKEMGSPVTKSSLMVGIGESREEVLASMEELRAANVDVLTLGQYLRPTPKHAPVERYVEPAEFDFYREKGLEMGFDYVASGPLVRSSYRAAEAFLHGKLRRREEGQNANGRQPSLPSDAAFDRYGKKHLAVVGS